MSDHRIGSRVPALALLGMLPRRGLTPETEAALSEALAPDRGFDDVGAEVVAQRQIDRLATVEKAGGATAVEDGARSLHPDPECAACRILRGTVDYLRRTKGFGHPRLLGVVSQGPDGIRAILRRLTAADLATVPGLVCADGHPFFRLVIVGGEPIFLTPGQAHEIADPDGYIGPRGGNGDEEHRAFELAIQPGPTTEGLALVNAAGERVAGLAITNVTLVDIPADERKLILGTCRQAVGEHVVRIVVLVEGVEVGVFAE